MPKQKKADEKSYRKNPTPKATRRSERTRANVERRKAKHERHLTLATNRRTVAVLTPMQDDFMQVRGRARIAAIKRAERAEFQQLRIGKKQQSRIRVALAKKTGKRKKT